MSAGEGVRIPGAGGAALAGRWFPAPGSVLPTVLCLGALAAPQRYLRHLAAWLAEQGHPVLTCDYRGVGASREAGRPTSTLDDWGHDARAALDWARQRRPQAPLLVFAHSIGGMLLGHAGLGSRVDGAVLLAATLGSPRYYRGWARRRLRLAYALLPRLAALPGDWIARPWALREAVPRDVVRHWARWGRAGRFLRWDGTPSAPGFAAFRGPLLGVQLADDGDAPLAAVDALLACYPRARVRRLVVGPTEIGAPVGHFGLFRPGVPRSGWELILGWLRDVRPCPTPRSP